MIRARHQSGMDREHRHRLSHPHVWRYIATNEPWVHERCDVCAGLRVRHARDGDTRWVLPAWFQAECCG